MIQTRERISILLVWGYERKSWIHPFESLKEKFDFTYLRYVYPEEEKSIFTDQKRIFWSEFDNVNLLLDTVLPDKVVFMSISSGLEMLLNNACKRRKIRTYILQHGLFTIYKDYRLREKLKKDAKETGLQTKGNFSSLKFLRKSLSVYDPIRLIKFPLYLYLMNKVSALYAARHVRFNARIPDYYVCYTKKNARIHFELDKPDKDQLIYIGNPEFDEIVKKWETTVCQDEQYYLHIDQAIADNKWGEHIVSRNEAQEFYLKLNEFCLSTGTRLKVKLHPESYNSEWLPAHENIDWIKDSDSIISLLKGAKGIFGFYSTLLIPAVYYKKVILFEISYSDFQKQLVKLGLVKLMNYFKFASSEINFDEVEKKDNSLRKYVDDYLFKADGNALGRLEEVLKK